MTIRNFHCKLSRGQKFHWLRRRVLLGANKIRGTIGDGGAVVFFAGVPRPLADARHAQADALDELAGVMRGMKGGNQ